METIDQVMDKEIYYRKERVRIIKEVRSDYLIENVDTGTHYLIDKIVFARNYASEGELIPVHTEVWQKLDNQGLQLFQLRRANTNLRKKLRRSERRVTELLGEQKKKQHYRNGQKRGRTRNG